MVEQGKQKSHLSWDTIFNSADEFWISREVEPAREV